MEQDKISELMERLREEDIPISREAVVIMLDDGMLTEETKFAYYLRAKQIAEELGIDTSKVIS